MNVLRMEILQCWLKVKHKRHPMRETIETQKWIPTAMGSHHGGWQKRVDSGFKHQHDLTIIMLLVNDGTVDQNHIILGALSSAFPELCVVGFVCF